MALYHLSMQNLGKSGGRSAVAAAAYRSATSLAREVVDPETGVIDEQVFDYGNKKGVEFSKIFAPSDLSDWCYNREQLWNKVEESETRINSRYARDINVALQTEFTLEQNIELMSEFVHENFVLQGIIADVNIHLDDKENPHAHIMLTTRSLEKDETGETVFGKKSRALESPSSLYFLRRRWADINNKYFMIHGIDKYITHESYEARGLGFIQATKHEGAATHTEGVMERIENNKKVIEENLEYIRNNPGEILKAIAKNKPVFSKVDIAKEVDSFFNEIAFRGIAEYRDELESVKGQVMQHYDGIFMDIMNADELVKVCDKDLNDRVLYTTKAQLELEDRFLSHIDYLDKEDKHALHIDHITPAPSPSKLQAIQSNLIEQLSNILGFEVKKAKGTRELNEEQKNAILNIVNGKDISLLIGRPGTGKSTVMSRVAQEYKEKGYNVVGAAFSGVAAKNLAEAASIKSFTLSKWEHDWQMRENLSTQGVKPLFDSKSQVERLLPKLTSKDVFIIDEMSMVDLKMMNYILTQVKEAGCKVIFVGDDNQFSSVMLGGASDKLVERLELVTLNEVFRQKNKIDREITNKLAEYRVDSAIEMLIQNEKFVLKRNIQETRQELINDYLGMLNDTTNNTKSQETMVIAYENKEVKTLNLEIRDRLIRAGVLQTKHFESGGRELYNANGGIKLAIGEHLVFTKNNKRLGVVNGQLARVIKIKANGQFNVQVTEKVKGKKTTREITIDPSKYNHFDYGYAITAYKAQGKTYDNCLVFIDKQVGYESFNVMATRHKYDAKFYIDQELLKGIIDKRFGLNKESITEDLDSNAVKGDNIRDKNAIYTEENTQAALFELLSRRTHSHFASDYKDLESNPYAKVIREYLEYRDEAANLYQEMLEWKEEQNRNLHNNITSKRNKPLRNYDVWHHESWNMFIEYRDKRDLLAKEIIEGFKDYRKYIANTNINYSTLLKHAKLDKLRFDYQVLDGNKSKEHIITHEKSRIISQNHRYNTVVDTHVNMLKGDNGHLTANLIKETTDLLAENEEHKLKLKDLTFNLSTLENNQWELETKKKASIYAQEDFKHYLQSTFKAGPEHVINQWNNLKRKVNLKKALEEVANNPELLSDLIGIGIGKHLAITVERSQAVNNIQTIKPRFKDYEHNKEILFSLDQEINQLNKDIISIKINIDNVKNSSLTSLQEGYLIDIIKHQNNINDWILTPQAIKYIENSLEDSFVARLDMERLEEENNNDSTFNDSLNQKEEAERELGIAFKDKTTKSSKNYQPSPHYTMEEIHSMLFAKVNLLSKELLPKFVGKPIETSGKTIKCGSLNISLEQGKEGLWHRFSTAEGGNLFNLIEKAQGYNSIKDSLDWAKDWLNIKEISKEANIESNLVSETTEVKISKEAKVKPIKLDKWQVILPAPENAAEFNPTKSLHYKLRDQANVLEDVYEYRSVGNELFGYVARIKNIETNEKETLPIVYAKNLDKGIEGWRLKGFGDNRPLYNEHLLNTPENANKPVLIVEGEKTANVASELYPEFVVISWSGGANAYKKSDWSALKDREVIIWPDNDEPGFKAAEGIKAILEANKENNINCKIANIKNLHLPKNWDLADELPEGTHNYQILERIFEKSTYIQNEIKNEKILNEYITSRKQEFNDELKTSKFDNFIEYLSRKNEIDNLLKIEKELVEKALLNSSQHLEQVFIAIDARKTLRMEEHNISTLNDPEALALYLGNKINSAHKHISQDLIKSAVHTSINYIDTYLVQNEENLKSKIPTSKNNHTNVLVSIMSEILINDHLETGHDINTLIKRAQNNFNNRIHAEMLSFEHHQQIQQQIQKNNQLEMDR